MMLLNINLASPHLHLASLSTYFLLACDIQLCPIIGTLRIIRHWVKHGMEWNGMDWNGMVWNGMEWIGMEWNIIRNIFFSPLNLIVPLTLTPRPPKP